MAVALAMLAGLGAVVGRFCRHRRPQMTDPEIVVHRPAMNDYETLPSGPIREEQPAKTRQPLLADKPQEQHPPINRKENSSSDQAPEAGKPDSNRTNASVAADTDPMDPDSSTSYLALVTARPPLRPTGPEPALGLVRPQCRVAAAFAAGVKRTSTPKPAITTRPVKPNQVKRQAPGPPAQGSGQPE